MLHNRLGIVGARSFRTAWSSRDRSFIVCRVIFEFWPRQGGSIYDTTQLAAATLRTCPHQLLVVPAAESDTSEMDAALGIAVIRVQYPTLTWLKRLKARWLEWLPVAPLEHLTFCLAAIPTIVRIHRRTRISILDVHGVGLAPCLTLLGKVLRVPVVLTLHGSLSSYSRRSGLFETVAIVASLPDHVWVVDNGGPMLDKARQLVPASRLGIVYIYVDANVMSPRVPSPTLLGTHGLEGRFVVISLHNLEPVQGVEYSIKAFARFLRLEPNAQATLLVVGDGAIRGELEALASAVAVRDSVRFVGAIANEQVPEYYALADVALFTSVSLNVNRSMMEAMACGKAIVAFDTGNTTDYALQPGVTVLLTAVGDVEAVGAQLQRLWRDRGLARKLGERGRRFVVEERNWDKRVDMELEVYRTLNRT